MSSLERFLFFFHFFISVLLKNDTVKEQIPFLTFTFFLYFIKVVKLAQKKYFFVYEQLHDI